MSGGEKVARRPRLVSLLRQPAETGELAEPGTVGRLELAAEVNGETVKHTGRYVYVGVVRGLHAFAPAAEPVLFLQRSEVVSFKTGGKR